MRKFKCIQDVVSTIDTTIYFKAGNIYEEVGYNYGGIILLDEKGSIHTLRDDFWIDYMVEIDDTTLDIKIK